MILERPIRYRDRESEKVVVEILENMNARDAFLRDREGYLSHFNLPSNAKSTLLSMPDEQIMSAANEYSQNIVGISGYGDTCHSSTAADLFCDE